MKIVNIYNHTKPTFGVVVIRIMIQMICMFSVSLCISNLDLKAMKLVFELNQSI